MKEPKDKRTTEYKEWKTSLEKMSVLLQPTKSIQDKQDSELPVYEAKFVGDDINISLTDKPLKGQEFIVLPGKETEEDCGCNKPKEVVLKTSSRELTEDELIEWEQFKSSDMIFTSDVIDYIHNLYESLFNIIVAKPILNGSHAPLNYMIENIDKLYNESK